jgi:uncharacterized protein
MNTQVIERTADYMKERLSNESSGHDWWHVYRVWRMGRKIATSEGANLYVVELACLLHDIADYKLHGGNEEIGPRLAGEWLEKMQVEGDVISHVCEIIKEMSFKGAGVKTQMRTKEGMVVQDADRLDAIGAIGIARCFAFGGAKGNVIYDPSIPVKMDMSEEEYKKANYTQINHFYEKLMLLKDRMNTQTAKRMAEEKHQFMERFLGQFHREWNVE